MRKLFHFAPLTPRDAAAPDLLGALTGDGTNDGPPFIAVAEPIPDPVELAAAAAAKPNDMQHALATTAALLPTAGADQATHVARLAAVKDTAPKHLTVAGALADIITHLQAFFGQL